MTNAVIENVSGAKKKRVAFILVDGLADVSIPSLGCRTPVQAASTPNMDAMARAGVNGLMDPVEPGLACGSDTAHLSLLGYDPLIYYRGRGAFESLGAGLAMSPGDIAFKSNFATIDDASGIVTSRRADRHFEEEGPILCAALNGLKLPSFPEYQVCVRFHNHFMESTRTQRFQKQSLQAFRLLTQSYDLTVSLDLHDLISWRYATEHRCGVVVKGPGLSGNITGTDPLKDKRPLQVVVPLEDSDEAKHTAAVVNELSKEMRRILAAHPLNAQRQLQGKSIANVVLLRGCGIRIEVPTFEERHGLAPCMVAPTKIIAGLGLSLGIDILDAPGATGDYRTLLTSKATAIASALAAPSKSPPSIFIPGEEESKHGRNQGYDFGFLHIKAIDDAGHDKAVELKVRALEAVDVMIGQLARLLWEEESSNGKFEFSLCITGDHSTPVEYGDHSFEPVPFTICHLKDFVAAKGGDSIVLSTDLSPFNLPIVGSSALAALAEKASARDTRDSCDSPVAGDSVVRFDEISAARGCLGRFQGSEMMGIIEKYIHL